VLAALLVAATTALVLSLREDQSPSEAQLTVDSAESVRV
jgi:cytochrome c oxidase assembly protein subunit 15